MKKLAGFISLLCILNVLAIGGIVGYLMGSGRLNKEKALSISDMLRQRGTPTHLRDKIYDVMNPVPESAPATTTAPAVQIAVEADRAPALSEERNNYLKQAVEEERLRLENEAQNQRHTQERLDHLQAQLQEQGEKLKTERAAFEKQLNASNSKSDTAAFEKIMGWFDQLKPKQIKDLLIGMGADEAARYFSAMDAEQVGKIAGEFKTQTEKDYFNNVVDRIRKGGNGSGTSAASGVVGATASAAAAPGAVVPPVTP